MSGESPVDPERAAEAEQLKNKGNEFFAKQMWTKAIDFYSQAIDINPLPAYLCNRAFAHLKNDCPGTAMADATRSIEIDEKFVKAYYRRATAYVALGKWKEALKDYRRVVQLRPNDPDGQKKFRECEKEVKRIAFLAAIETADAGALLDKYEDGGETPWREMAVPATYTGPVLQPGGVTVEYVDKLTELLAEEKMPPKRDVIGMLVMGRTLLRGYPNVTPVNVPEGCKVNVCGDVHGQFYDLLHLFKLGGNPSPTNWYLFNGDFVDRGSYSVECFLLILAYKLLYPDFFFLSRGNHEGRNLNRVYGFEGELQAKLQGGNELFEMFQEIFNSIPLAHVINGKVYTVHGGLFEKDGVTIADINKVNRFREPEEGLMAEMLWSDPQPMPGRAPNKRGVGVSFGPDVTKNFLETNGLDYVIRSHEVKDEGYVVEHDGKCITVFSAPNYCDQMGNKAAFITLTPPDLKPKYTVFTHQPHPGKKPMQYARLFQFQ